MSAVQNGQIIEACLYLLDRDPAPHSAFGCSAIPIANIARQLLVHPGQIASGQVVEAIAPLAETLFPQPRQPVPRVLNGERWIVFETSSPRPDLPSQGGRRMHRRNTLLNRPPPRPDIVPPVPPLAAKPQPALPPLPSAPLRKSPSDELVQDLDVTLEPEGQSQPRSASHGKRSFLRPFLLKSKSKKKTPDPGPLPPTPPKPASSTEIRSPDSWTHVSPQAPTRSGTMMTQSQDVSAIVDDYLEDVKTEVESPYEETAFIDESPPVQPPNHPLRQATLPLAATKKERAPEAPVEAAPPAYVEDGRSKGAVEPEKMPQSEPAMVEPDSSLMVTPPVTPAKSPSPCPTITPQASSPPNPQKAPTSQIASRPRSDERSETAVRTDRREERYRDERHRSQNPSRRDIKDRREHHRTREAEARRDDEPRERHRVRDRDLRRSERDKRSRRPRDKKPEEAQTWLEGVFDGLPFGPNISRVSSLPRHLERTGEELIRGQVKVVDSVQRDWRLFMAELVALVGLAYVVQASGW